MWSLLSLINAIMDPEIKPKNIPKAKFLWISGFIGFLYIKGFEITFQGISFWAISNWKVSLAETRLRRFSLAICSSCSRFWYFLIRTGCSKNLASKSFWRFFVESILPWLSFKAVSTASSWFLSKTGWICLSLRFKPFIILELLVYLDFAEASSFSTFINCCKRPWSKSLIDKPSFNSFLKPLAVILPLFISSFTSSNLSLSLYKEIRLFWISFCLSFIVKPSLVGWISLCFSRKATSFVCNSSFFFKISGACLFKKFNPSINLCCFCWKEASR